MPQVPRYTGQQVEAKPLRGAYQDARPYSPGALNATANTIDEAGTAMMNIGKQMQEREDADLLMRAETEVKSKYSEWEAEANQRRGQQAWGVAKEAGEWWDKEAAKASGILTTERQKFLFGQKVQQMKGLSVGAFAGHEAGQRRESLAEATDASIVGSINMAAANPGNTQILSATKDDIVKRTAMLAQINGWVPKVRDAKQSEFLTNFHKQVIQGLVRDQPEAAQAYFEANKGEIAGQFHAEIGAFAVKATATRVGEAAADAAWQQLGPKGDRDPVQLDKLLEAVRKRTDLGEEAKHTAAVALKERAGAFKDARRERDEGLEAKVNLAVMQGAGASQIGRMPEFMQMDGEKQRRLMDFIENKALRAEQVQAARAGRAAAEESRAEAREARNERRVSREGAIGYLTYSDPDVLVGMNENQIIGLMPHIGIDQTKKLMEQRRELEKPGKLIRARLDNDMFNSVMASAGFDPKPGSKNKTDMQTVYELRTAVEQRVEALQRSSKRELSGAETLKVMQEIIHAEVLQPGKFWGTNPANPYLLPLADLEKSTVTVRGVFQGRPADVPLKLSTIPTSEYAAVEKQLRSEGAPTDPASVARAWYEFTQRKKAK